MLGEAGEGEADRDLAGAGRPAALALDRGEALAEAAEVEEEVRELAADRHERLAEALAGGDHRIRRRRRPDRRRRAAPPSGR